MKNWCRLYILKIRDSVSCRFLRQQFYLNFIGNCLSYTAWSGFSYETTKYLFLVNACLLSVKGVKWDSPGSFMCIRETPSDLVGKSFIRVPLTFEAVSDSPMVQGWLKLCTYTASPVFSQCVGIATKSYNPRWEMMHFNTDVSILIYCNSKLCGKALVLVYSSCLGVN